MSADGHHIAFSSTARNLVPNDGNTERDVFVRGPDPDDLSSDLNGDLDLDDTVLQVVDTASNPVRLTTIGPVLQVAVAEGAAAFLSPESADRIDRNGDGDLDDAFVHLARAGGAPEDLGKEAVEIAMSDVLIAAVVPTGVQGETAVEVYGWQSAAPEWTTVGTSANRVRVVGPVVAYLTTGDRNLQAYRADAGRSIDVGRSAEEFVLGDRLIAFSHPRGGARRGLEPGRRSEGRRSSGLRPHQRAPLQHHERHHALPAGGVRPAFSVSREG